jgi:pimeloyl-ACP methyl ester carboxylesterase
MLVPGRASEGEAWSHSRVTLPPAQRWPLTVGEIHVREAGRQGGAPTVLVHGLGGSALNWVPLMEQLEGHVAALAVDLPGFGQSPPPRDGDYSPRGHARAVAASIVEWRRRVDFDGPVHVMGNSMGGAVALQLAARRPDLVASLTLVSPALPSARLGRGNAHLPVVAVPGVGEALVRRYAAVPVEQRVQATLDACTTDPARVPEVLRAALVAETAQRDSLPYAHDAFLSSLRGLLSTYADRGPRRPWRLARQVRQPVLAIYGADDVLVDARGAARAAREFPDADVVLLDDCGHVAQMEHPDLVADLWTGKFTGVSEAVSTARGSLEP